MVPGIGALEGHDLLRGDLHKMAQWRTPPRHLCTGARRQCTAPAGSRSLVALRSFLSAANLTSSDTWDAGKIHTRMKNQGLVRAASVLVGIASVVCYKPARRMSSDNQFLDQFDGDCAPPTKQTSVCGRKPVETAAPRQLTWPTGCLLHTIDGYRLPWKTTGP